MVRRDRNPPPQSPGQKVRQLWAAFEQWLEAPKASMLRETDVQLKQIDDEWNLKPAVLRPTREEHERQRMDVKKTLCDGFAVTVQEEWQRRLDDAGLRNDDWGRMSSEEMQAVDRALLSSGNVSPPPPMAYPSPYELPSSLPSPASSNSFTFVSPDSFTDDDEDDAQSGMQDYGALTSVPNHSALDDMFATTPVQPYSRSGSYTEWGLDSSASSAKSSMHSSATSSLVSSPSAVSRHLESFASFSEDKHASRPSHSQKYIGPVLCSSPPPSSDEEEDFENYKMEIRILKIKEFHAEAAEADIQLYHSIQLLRRENRNHTHKEVEKQMIADHEQRMLQLRRTKDEERKVVVDAERRRRREEMTRRKDDERREREAREREDFQQLQLLQLPTPHNLPPQIPLATKPLRKPVMFDDRSTPMPSSTMPGSFDLPALSATPTPATLAKKSGWKTASPSVAIPQDFGTPASQYPIDLGSESSSTETATPVSKKGKAAMRKSKLSQVATAPEPTPAPVKVEPPVTFKAPEPEPAFTMTKVKGGKQKGKRAEPPVQKIVIPPPAPEPVTPTKSNTSSTSSTSTSSSFSTSTIATTISSTSTAPKIASTSKPVTTVSSKHVTNAPAKSNSIPANASKPSPPAPASTTVSPPTSKVANSPPQAPTIWKPAQKSAPAPAPAPAQKVQPTAAPKQAQAPVPKNAQAPVPKPAQSSPPTAALSKDSKSASSSSFSTSASAGIGASAHQVWLPKGHASASSKSQDPSPSSGSNSGKKSASSTSTVTPSKPSSSQNSKKKVKVEEVADEETFNAPASQDTLPHNSAAILEPKPQVPQSSFNPIIDYEEKKDKKASSSSSSSAAPAKVEKSSSGNSGNQVRWTPTTSTKDIDGTPGFSSGPGGTIRANNKKATPAVNNIFATFQPPLSPPSPATSPEETDDLAWFARQALASYNETAGTV